MNRTDVYRIVAESNTAGFEKIEAAMRELAAATAAMALSLERLAPASRTAESAIAKSGAANAAAAEKAALLIAANEAAAASFATLGRAANAASVGVARRMGVPYYRMQARTATGFGAGLAPNAGEIARAELFAKLPAQIQAAARAMASFGGATKAAFGGINSVVSGMGAAFASVGRIAAADPILSSIGRAALAAGAALRSLSASAITLATRGFGALVAAGERVVGVLGGIGAAAAGMAAAASRALGGLSVAAGAIGVAAIASGAQFEQATNRVFALTNITEKQFAGLQEQILEVSRTVPLSLQELSEGFYYIVSAGIDAADALEVLRVSAQAAVAGQADLATVADGVTSVMLAYTENGYTAAQAAGILTRATILGKTEFDTFAHSIGRVLPLAAQLDVGFEEVAASLAVMTRLGLNSDEAATALRATMASLTAPAKETQDELKNIGLTAQGLRDIIAERGLVYAFHMLYEETGGNIDRLDKIIPNIRGLTGFLTLANSQGKEFADVLADIKKNMGTATATAFERAMTTLLNQLSLVGNQLRVLAFRYFVAVSGGLKTATNWVWNLIDGLNTWIRQNKDLFTSIAQVVSQITAFVLAGFGIPLILQAFGGFLGIFGAFVPVATRASNGVKTVQAVFKTLLPVLTLVGIGFLVLSKIADPARWNAFAQSVGAVGNVIGDLAHTLATLGGGLFAFITEGPQEISAVNMIDDFQQHFAEAWSRLRMAIGRMVTNFFNVFDPASGFRRAFQRAIDVLLYIDPVGAIARWFDGLVRGFISESASGTSRIIQVLDTVRQGIFQWLMDAIPAIARTLHGWTDSFIRWAAEVWPALRDALVDAFSSFWVWLAGNGDTIGTALARWTASFMNWVFTEFLPAVIQGIGGVMDAMLAVMAEVNFYEQLTRWTVDFVSWVIVDLIPRLVLALAGLATQLAFEVGPRIVAFFVELGGQIIAGMVEGILDAENPLEFAIRAVIALITGPLLAAFVLWRLQLMTIAAWHTILAVTNIPALIGSIRLMIGAITTGLLPILSAVPAQLVLWMMGMGTLSRVIPAVVSGIVALAPAIAIAGAALAAFEFGKMIGQFVTAGTVMPAVNYEMRQFAKNIEFIEGLADRPADQIREINESVADLRHGMEDLPGATKGPNAIWDMFFGALNSERIGELRGQMDDLLERRKEFFRLHPTGGGIPDESWMNAGYAVGIDKYQKTWGDSLTAVAEHQRQNIIDTNEWADQILNSLVDMTGTVNQDLAQLQSLFGDNLKLPDVKDLMVGTQAEQIRGYTKLLAELPEVGSKAWREMTAAQQQAVIASRENWTVLRAIQVRGIDDMAVSAHANVDKVLAEFERMITLGGLTPEEATRRIRRMLADGFAGAKFKVPWEGEYKPDPKTDKEIREAGRLARKHFTEGFTEDGRKVGKGILGGLLPDPSKELGRKDLFPSGKKIVGTSGTDAVDVYATQLSAGRGSVRRGAITMLSGAAAVMEIHSEPTDKGSPLSGITEWGVNIGTTIATGLASTTAQMVAAAQAVGFGVQLGFQFVMGQAMLWGLNTAQAYAAGLSSPAAQTAVYNAALSLSSQVSRITKADSPPGVESPLHNIMDWGFNTMDAFADGMLSAEDRVANAARKVVGVAADAMKQGISVEPKLQFAGAATGRVRMPIRDDQAGIPHGIEQKRQTELMAELLNESKVQSHQLSRWAAREQTPAGPLAARSELDTLRLMQPYRRR